MKTLGNVLVACGFVTAILCIGLLPADVSAGVAPTILNCNHSVCVLGTGCPTAAIPGCAAAVNDCNAVPADCTTCNCTPNGPTGTATCECGA